MLARKVWMAVLVAASLAGAGPGPEPLRPSRSPTVLPFSEAQGIVSQAAGVARELLPGEVVVLPTPQGPRRALLLNYQGRPVAFAFLGPGPTLVGGGAAPLQADAPETLPALSDAETADLARSVARLSVSGLVQVVGPQARVYLLLDGRQVAELRFDRRSGTLIADPGGPPKGPRRPPRP